VKGSPRAAVAAVGLAVTAAQNRFRGIGSGRPAPMVEVRTSTTTPVFLAGTAGTAGTPRPALLSAPRHCPGKLGLPGQALSDSARSDPTPGRSRAEGFPACRGPAPRFAPASRSRRKPKRRPSCWPCRFCCRCWGAADGAGSAAAAGALLAVPVLLPLGRCWPCPPPVAQAPPAWGHIWGHEAESQPAHCFPISVLAQAFDSTHNHN
jgi:hypothetical protein